jgi:uncharacterized protein with HEPN domain
MKRPDTIYLRHVLDAIAKIERYLTSVDEAIFYNESLIQDDVIRHLEIIGEAVKQLGSETRKEALHIPWSAIAGMRDKLIHHYFGVDLGQIWLTAQNDIPPLKAAVAAILNNR